MIRFNPFFPLTFCLLPLLAQAVTVTLQLSAYHANPMMAMMNAQTCTNLPPGRCCQGRPPPAFMQGLAPDSPPSPDYRSAQWAGLQLLDIAAVWQPRGNNAGCSGTPVATHAIALPSQPDHWRYPTFGDSDVMLSGASYIRVPQTLPKDGDAASWLEAEGILGLVTGGGKYISKKVGSPLLQQAAAEALRLWGGGGSHKFRRRDIRAGFNMGHEGVVYAQPPGVSVWPDLITLNGTEYVEESPGSPIYKSAGGEVLNMTVTGN